MKQRIARRINKYRRFLGIGEHGIDWLCSHTAEELTRYLNEHRNHYRQAYFNSRFARL